MNRQYVSALRRLHFEAIGGVAGDMLLAALLDAGADLSAIIRALEGLGVADMQLHVERVSVDGVDACYVRSLPSSGEPGHTYLSDIFEIIDRTSMTPAALRFAKDTFLLLAEAEAIAHGTTVGDVALHEVGEIDSIMDVVGVAVALDSFAAARITCAPLPSGHGTVETSHGKLECPVPAVCEIAKRCNIPLVCVDVEGETVTPTGIALMATACTDFEHEDAPNPSCVGVGAGTKRFDSRPNIIRVYGWEPE